MHDQPQDGGLLVTSKRFVYLIMLIIMIIKVWILRAISVAAAVCDCAEVLGRVETGSGRAEDAGVRS